MNNRGTGRKALPYHKKESKTMKKKYEIIGVWSMCNLLSLNLLKIDYDTMKVLTQYSHAGGRKAWSNMRVDRHGRDYINRGGRRYYFDQCMAIV